jgi:hypothetical protein
MLHRGGNVSFIGWVQATAGLILIRLRAAARATERLQDGLVMAERAGSRHETLRCTALLSRARWLTGDRDDALALAERAEHLYRSIVTPPGRVMLYLAPAISSAAEVLTDAGRPDAGWSLLSAAVEAARGPQRAWYAIPLSIAAARCLVAQERPDAAQRALAPALQAWHRQTFAPAWEALVVLAAVHRAAGRHAESEAQAHAARAAVAAVGDQLGAAELRIGLAEAAERELVDYAGASSHTTS